MEGWHKQGLQTLLCDLGDEDHLRKFRKQLEEGLSKFLDDVHKMLMDPLQRGTATECLAQLTIKDLQNSAFSQAKRRQLEFLDILNARNAEDDKIIRSCIEEFDFTGFRELLGQAPDKGSPEGGQSKLFFQRLEQVVTSVRNRLELAKQSTSDPAELMKEMNKLKAAKEQIGDYLKLYKDLYLFFGWSQRPSQPMQRLLSWDTAVGRWHWMLNSLVLTSEVCFHSQHPFLRGYGTWT